MACVIWSTASNKPAMARQPIRGSGMARTSRSVLPIWKRLLGRTCWRPCRSRPGCPERRSFPGCRKIFPRQSTSTPPRDASPRWLSWVRLQRVPQAQALRAGLTRALALLQALHIFQHPGEAWVTSGRAIDHVVLAVQDLDRTASRYQELGFTLTPRAAHEDRMGTSNRLAQFRARNFIELLEVDRPEGMARHDFAALPPFFSFGDHNRIAVREREGLSMLVFASNDARADILSFSSANLPTFAPFDFERHARLPDGAEVTVAFSLGFVQSPKMPSVAFFVCENRAQEYFWKPEYQSHANAATGIVAVYLSSMAPERDAAFV